MTVGILALQGCVSPHQVMLAKLGQNSREVRNLADLEAVDRLILPGGESSTMLKLMERQNLLPALREFGKTQAIWGICAGSILLAKEVKNPEQRSLNLIEIRATRNFYGSQLESFSEEIECLNKTITVDFIRAPLLEALSNKVIILAKRSEQAILMQQGRILVSSFHTELRADPSLHQYFLSL